MKKSLFFVTVICLFLLQAYKQADTAPITLNVNVSDDVCQNGQWVYWFSLNGNEYNIEDSCYLQKGQHSFMMKKIILDENDEMGSWLTFAKHGPLQAQLFLNKGENVTITVNKKGITKIEGSPETEDWYHIMSQMIETGKKDQALRKTLETTEDSLTRLRLMDSIHYLNNSTRLKSFKTIKTPKLFLIQLNIPGLPPKTVDSLATVMKRRFPNDERVQEYPRRPRFPTPTPHSDWVQQRLQKIWTKRTGFKYKRPAPFKLSAEQLKALSQIKMLKPGDKVNSLSFKGMNGKNIALKDIHTPYVLIDFWASWCNPCREEVPELKSVQSKYKGRLTVYSVSLDQEKSSWINAILTDKSNMLTQVIEDSSQFSRKKIQKLFGINSIPTNFLLDQHRKIIAIDVPGDSLENKMENIFRK